MTERLLILMHGALSLGCLLVAVKFLKYWRSSKDRFFLWFASAFLVFCVGWTMRALFPDAEEHAPYVFLPRLTAFLLIIAAIMDKNRSRAP